MTDDQLAAVRDALIAEVDKGPSPLACKFESYLRDQIGSGQKADDVDIARIKAECETFVTAAHNEAISRLREELANDPTNLGYAGQKPEAIQSLLMQQTSVYVEQDAPLTESEIVAVGVALANGLPYKPAPLKVQVLVTVRPPRIGTIWSGIPYTRNLPSLDNIAEALA